MQRSSPPSVDNNQNSPRTADGAATVSHRHVGAVLPRDASDTQAEGVLEIAFHTHNQPGTGS